MEGEKNGLAVLQIFQQLQQLFLTYRAKNSVGLVAIAILTQLGRNLHIKSFKPSRGIKLLEIVLIDPDDIALHRVHHTEIVCLYVGVHSLRHAADKHVKPELAHFLPVGSGQRQSLFEESVKQRHRRSVTHCPAELFVVHWI